MSELLLFARVVLLVAWNLVKSVVRCLTPYSLLRKKSVSGQVALVTGGGRGLGRHMALRLAELGATVVVWDVDLGGAEETCRTIREGGQTARAYFCDVSDREEVYRTAGRVRSEVGKVDILVNNAGVAMNKSFDELTDAAVEKVNGINLLAHYWTCRAFLPDMVRDNRGHVLAVSSAASFLPGPNLTDYCPTKSAVSAFMDCLRIDLVLKGSRGVRTTTACPFFVRTDLYRADLPWWITCMEAKDCARDIVDAMLRNKEVVVLPTYTAFLRGFQNLLSPKFFTDFLRASDVLKILGSFETEGISRVLASKTRNGTAPNT